ncbi:hypothetical protein J6590_064770 [Homalodisca vitripennis]|nr:hypothetical protein J6590_064770 [Homalodisca vitripennis]
MPFCNIIKYIREDRSQMIMKDQTGHQQQSVLVRDTLTEYNLVCYSALLCLLIKSATVTDRIRTCAISNSDSSPTS